MAKRYSGQKSGLPVFMLSGVILVIFILAFSGAFDKHSASSSSSSSHSSTGVGSNPGGKHGSLYTLSMGTDFKPGLSYRDDLGIAVVIVLDVSGSMADSPASGGEAKYLQATKALARIVDVLSQMTGPGKPLVKVGVLRFSDEVETVFPLATLDKEVISKLRVLTQNPQNFEPDGKTAIGSALEKGATMLAQSGTLMRSLIIVSDGENTSGPQPEEVLDAIYANRNDASTSDAVVNTSSTLIRFVGFDVENDYFQRFANYGARVGSAADGEQLSKELDTLLNADIKMLEAGN